MEEITIIKGTLAIKIRNIIIVTDNEKLKGFKIKLSSPDYHDVYHNLSSNVKGPFSFISAFIINPLLILSLEGSKKVNIWLFINFIKFHTLRNMNKINFNNSDFQFNNQKKWKINLSGLKFNKTMIQNEGPKKIVKLSKNIIKNLRFDQKFIYRLLRFSENAWVELMQSDTKAFIKLQNFFNINKILKFDEKVQKIMKLALKEKEFVVKCFSSIKTKFIKDFLIFEEEFCEINKPKESFCKSYIKMLKDLKTNKFDDMYEEMPFHKEIALINDYIISSKLSTIMNENLLYFPFETALEKQIQNLIIEKIYGRSGLARVYR